MKNNNRFKQALGVILFAIGVVVGIGVAIIAIPGDLEAMLFDAGLAHLREEALPSLRCPVIIDEAETGTVRATFKNPTDKDMEFRIFVHVSEYLSLWREEIETLPVAAGASESLEWTVTADDAVQGNLILVKVLRKRRYPLPAQLGSCGILVVDLPFGSGKGILTTAIVVTILGLAAGTGLWIIGGRPLVGKRRDLARAMVVLSLSVLGGMLVSLLGGWALGLLLVAFNLLLVGAVVGHTLSRR